MWSARKVRNSLPLERHVNTRRRPRFYQEELVPRAGEDGMISPNWRAIGRKPAGAAVAKALPNSPDGYTPSEVECQGGSPTIRSASTLSPHELAWLQSRRPKCLEAMTEWFSRLDIDEFSTDWIAERSEDELPNIGIAFSGGGYRALMNGAGAFAAFDSRSSGTDFEGPLQGLLQASTYVSGLSGGSWLVGSIYVNNFTTVSNLMAGQSGGVWDFTDSILVGPEGEDDYYRELLDDVGGKADEGFQVSITDYWGRALSYQLIDANDGGPEYTWSSIQAMQPFLDGEEPMPIIIALERAPGESQITLEASVFEFNPWELGTWDPTTYAFAPLQYIGSNFTAGQLLDSQCTVGYDNAGFLMGTSSTLFNQALLQVNNTELRDRIQETLTSLLQTLDEAQSDIAVFRPNPFFKYNNSTNGNRNSNSDTLVLVDGGEDLQNIPLHPLLQPARKLDVIVAIDSSADTESAWPNGTSLVATYQRYQNHPSMTSGGFPSIPDQNTFVNLGLNKRPTFFGCDPANRTGDQISPLIVYIPNAPYTDYSNVSTFDLAYETDERDAIIMNGYNVASMGNSSLDSNWPACLGCAVLSRSLDRTQSAVPQQCQDCLQRYCWDGTINSTVSLPYQPAGEGWPVVLRVYYEDTVSSTSLTRNDSES
ncbi:lysophospholipase catalytic domain-containing protein [Aspergillus karnatakaensis]|uniref:lysophospholipase catalytic domain-containing protein n=1 Tax=Aspergillus karnatakaensis TaxID=1810916 RepID=UPI003CCC8FFD